MYDSIGCRAEMRRYEEAISDKRASAVTGVKPRDNQTITHEFWRTDHTKLKLILLRD